MGECAGSPQFTHVSFDDFRIVHDNLTGGNRTTSGRLVPFCLFTDPELARVGLSESEARKLAIPYRLARLSMAAVLRTRTLSETRGFMKALIGEETDEILGFTAFGTQAGELMAVVQTAMIGKLPYTALRDAVFTHPTMAEGLTHVVRCGPGDYMMSVPGGNIMNVTIFERSVARIDRPKVQTGMTPEHRLRPLIPPGNPAETDPFLLLMEDWFPRGVFDRHPHRGMETVTFVIDGRLDHYDNYGNQGSLLPGNVQWMTAGRGIIHLEQPAQGVTVHSLQLWVNLPAADKMVEPRTQNLVAAELPLRREQGAEVRVFSGKSGEASAPTKNYAPVTMFEARLEAGAWIRQELPADYNAFLIVLEGDGLIGGDRSPVRVGDVVWLTRTDDDGVSELKIAGGTEPLRALLFAGRPLREPVVASGPFVMNTEEQIRQANIDYREGRFEPGGR